MNDGNKQHHHGHVPETNVPLSLTLNWRADGKGEGRLVGKYEIDITGLLKAGYVRREKNGIRLRFQRTGEQMEIAVARTRPALVIGRINMTTAPSSDRE